MKKFFVFLLFFFVTFINVYAEGNYVTKIIIDKEDFVTEFDSSKNTYEYTKEVDSNKNEIVISYICGEESCNGQGSSGKLSLKYGNNVFSYTLTNKENAKDTKVYKITVVRKDNRSSDNSLASLTVGGSKVVLGSGNEYSVDIDSNKKSIEVQATITSDKASFVDGYGPRTVSIDSTSCEIWVKAENEEIRKYKVTITKSNAKSNDATLKTLSTDKINFDFKPGTLEYKLTAASDIAKIKITAVPNSDKASLEYKEEHTLVTGENNIEIKVTAEDGTVKVYKLIVTKEKELPLVTDIKIKDVEFTFDSTKYSYTLETELTSLEFDVTLSKDTATSEIKGNENLKNGSVVTIEAKDGDKTVTYKFKILNNTKEEETITTGSKDVQAKTTTNNKEDFFQKNEMIIGLVIFGVGLFSLLAAILLKPKSKIM